MLQRTLPLIAVVVLAWSHNGWTGAYRWVDESGRVHYSQRPPPGQTAQPVQLPKTPRAAEPVTPHSASSKQPPEEAQTEEPPEQAQSTPAPESEETARQEAVAETKRKNCSTAKANLERLRAGRRITAKSADGKVYYLDEAEREAQVAEARTQLRANCQ